MSNSEDAHKYRLAQAAEILRIFEEENGRPARTCEEVEAWLASPKGRFRLEQKRKLRPGQSNN